MQIFDECKGGPHHIHRSFLLAFSSIRLCTSPTPRFPPCVTPFIFFVFADGLLLSKLINDSVADTIDERVLNKGPKLSKFQMTENNNVVINSAKAVGCNVVNIGSSDLIEGREHLILGLIWQIIKIGLLAKIDIKFCPELYRLLDKGETIEDLTKLPPDQVLLRWRRDCRKIWNVFWVRIWGQADRFSFSVSTKITQVLVNADKIGCRKYLNVRTLTEGNAKLNLAFVAHLFNTLPGLKPLSEQEKAALDEWLFSSEGDREARGELRLNFRRMKSGLSGRRSPSVGRHFSRQSNSRAPPKFAAFALWMNSLGVDPFLNNLFEDLRDGLVLLQAIDKVQPGAVDWKKVNKQTPITSKFKRVENCNYVIVLGKAMRFSLVGIGGTDIQDGNKKLTLGWSAVVRSFSQARRRTTFRFIKKNSPTSFPSFPTPPSPAVFWAALVWQLMRENIVQTLKLLSKNGKEVTDADMIEWANATVRAGGKSSTMASFKDPSLGNGTYFLDLLHGMRNGIVDYNLVTDGVGGKQTGAPTALHPAGRICPMYRPVLTVCPLPLLPLSPPPTPRLPPPAAAKIFSPEERAKLNAKYAISIARKMGATIFCLPEDIVEVKAKMNLTFVGALMAVSLRGGYES
ncbi:MAG: hypothetical protein BJ554DRAFT_3615 [Olpidium bornovanus]|uniref:Calponin-homology (CH) domain-containing protein n=1 Tax=Olpidium bornovanus TaxID=278681 RepID=A0A8H7ZP80_9FUNG|nr:MAG: hypothetical protein BJ554DRAFT_3615 [Olpidium bornovanus]